jgi:hypothetical protein
LQPCLLALGLHLPELHGELTLLHLAGHLLLSQLKAREILLQLLLVDRLRLAGYCS